MAQYQNSRGETFELPDDRDGVELPDGNVVAVPRNMSAADKAAFKQKVAAKFPEFGRKVAANNLENIRKNIGKGTTYGQYRDAVREHERLSGRDRKDVSAYENTVDFVQSVGSGDVGRAGTLLGRGIGDIGQGVADGVAGLGRLAGGAAGALGTGIAALAGNENAQQAVSKGYQGAKKAVGNALTTQGAASIGTQIGNFATGAAEGTGLYNVLAGSAAGIIGAAQGKRQNARDIALALEYDRLKRENETPISTGAGRVAPGVASGAGLAANAARSARAGSVAKIAQSGSTTAAGRALERVGSAARTAANLTVPTGVALEVGKGEGVREAAATGTAAAALYGAGKGIITGSRAIANRVAPDGVFGKGSRAAEATILKKAGIDPDDIQARINDNRGASLAEVLTPDESQRLGAFLATDEASVDVLRKAAVRQGEDRADRLNSVLSDAEGLPEPTARGLVQKAETGVEAASAPVQARRRISERVDADPAFRDLTPGLSDEQAAASARKALDDTPATQPQSAASDAKLPRGASSAALDARDQIAVADRQLTSALKGNQTRFNTEAIKSAIRQSDDQLGAARAAKPVVTFTDADAQALVDIIETTQLRVPKKAGSLDTGVLSSIIESNKTAARPKPISINTEELEALRQAISNQVANPDRFGTLAKPYYDATVDLLDKYVPGYKGVLQNSSQLRSFDDGFSFGRSAIDPKGGLAAYTDDAVAAKLGNSSTKPAEAGGIREGAKQALSDLADSEAGRKRLAEAFDNPDYVAKVERLVGRKEAQRIGKLVSTAKSAERTAQASDFFANAVRPGASSSVDDVRRIAQGLDKAELDAARRNAVKEIRRTIDTADGFRSFSSKLESPAYREVLEEILGKERFSVLQKANAGTAARKQFEDAFKHGESLFVPTTKGTTDELASYLGRNSSAASVQGIRTAALDTLRRFTNSDDGFKSIVKAFGNDNYKDLIKEAVGNRVYDDISEAVGSYKKGISDAEGGLAEAKDRLQGVLAGKDVLSSDNISDFRAKTELLGDAGKGEVAGAARSRIRDEIRRGDPEANTKSGQRSGRLVQRIQNDKDFQQRIRLALGENEGGRLVQQAGKEAGRQASLNRLGDDTIAGIGSAARASDLTNRGFEAIAFATGPTSAFYKTRFAAALVRGRIPSPLAKRLAEKVTDPAKTAEVISFLRRRGLRQKDFDNIIRSTVSGVTLLDASGNSISTQE